MKICYFIVFSFLQVVLTNESPSCITPNGEAATCVPLVVCKVLIPAAISEEPIATKFYNESLCDIKTSTVCCGTTGKYTHTLTTPKPLSIEETFDGWSKEEKKNYVLKKILPTQFCGLQHTDDYFYNGTETSVDEFPWLVYINKKYVHEEEYLSRTESNCVGVLISSQYVLTSFDCFNDRKYATGNTVRNVLLGVHHIYKKINCIQTRFGDDDCTNPSLRVSISNWTIFNEEIVLLRLNKKVIYTDYLRPICLPLQPEQIPKAGSLAVASGWSEEEFFEGKTLNVKKRMKYTIMSTKDCENGNTQKYPICAIPFENNTQYFCNGDKGGPLMHQQKDLSWFVVGLIYLHYYFGDCDGIQPITAIRLTPEIINWIIENLKP